jgi:NAD(P)-dependent dehydrogenase (short-subunit alcohol dehydrogenase family)
MKKAALITGASRRIGRAIALHLGGQDIAVAVHYRGSGEAAEETAEAIRQAGGSAATVQADLASEAETAKLFDAAAEALGTTPTILINNASCFEQDDVTSATEESWSRHMRVNLRAPFLLSQCLAAHAPKDAAPVAGSWGNIINIIDQRVWRLTPDFTSYTVSKAALWTLTQTLAQGLAPHIRVNAIGPGPVLASRQQDADAFAREAAAIPLQKGPTPEEIARAISFVLESPSMTGQMIALDGGQHLAWQTPDFLAGDSE